MISLLLACRNKEHHNGILHIVIERTTRNSLRLNFEKCHIREQSVSYVGHLITADGLEPDPEKEIRSVAEMADPM